MQVLADCRLSVVCFFLPYFIYQNYKGEFYMETISEEYILPIFVFTQYPKLKLNETIFCILDTETTGINNDDEVVKLAVINMLGYELYHSCFELEKEAHWAAAKKPG